MKIVIAPNEFKESLKVLEVVKIFKAGVKKVFPSAEIIEAPIADGGDGTLDVFYFNLGGKKIFYNVMDPLLSQKHRTPILYINRTAIIEIASSTGLKLVSPNKRNPLHTSSYGTGELMMKALQKGATEIWLAAGGSSTVDGAIGILSALGCKFLDKKNKELLPVGGSLPYIKKIKLSPICKNFPAKIKIITDVRNKLLGPGGGVKIFAPQKGASPEEVALLEVGMQNWAKITQKIIGVNPQKIIGGGAAGGIPAFLQAYLKAEIIDGAEFIIEKINLQKKFKKADLLISGEGKIDLTTLQGKAPYVAAKIARKNNVRVIWVGGSIEFNPELYKWADIIYPAVTKPMPIEEAIKNSKILVKRAVEAALLIHKN